MNGLMLGVAVKRVKFIFRIDGIRRRNERGSLKTEQVYSFESWPHASFEFA